jgi:hypothetical protein
MAKGNVIQMHRINLKVCIPRKIEEVQGEEVNEGEKEKKVNRVMDERIVLKN